MRDVKKLSFHPIEHQEIHDLYQKHQGSIWGPGSIPINDDLKDFEMLSADTKRYIKFLLSLFAQLDGIVTENLMDHFCGEIGDLCKEAGNFFRLQAYMETVHNETYSLMLEAFIPDVSEREKSLDSITNYPEIKGIADWAFKWMDPSIPLGERIIAFSAIEGVIFSSAFAGIYYLKSDNYLTALSKANEWISRDEAIHTIFGYTIYRVLVSMGAITPVPKDRVVEIIKSAVEVNEVFTREAMNCKLVGIDVDDMMSYVKTTADFLCEKYCSHRIYNVPNRLEGMMAMISLPNRSNFFETMSTEYNSGSSSKSGRLTYPRLTIVDELLG